MTLLLTLAALTAGYLLGASGARTARRQRDEALTAAKRALDGWQASLDRERSALAISEARRAQITALATYSAGLSATVLGQPRGEG